MATTDRELLEKIVADYDLRRKHWWGRFLLWLLLKTTKGVTHADNSKG